MPAKKKSAGKKSSAASKSSAKGASKKAASKSTGTKAASKKAGGRKYSPAASASVEREMDAMKKGKLKSGSGRKVKNPKQAIAIGLSEARKAGAEMPPPPRKSASAKKSSGKKRQS